MRSALMEVVRDLTNFNHKKLDDPYLTFGHGILAFFRMLQYMICVFLLISIIMITVMYVYSSEAHESFT